MEDERTVINPADYFSPDARHPEPGFLRKAYMPTVMGGIGVSLAMFANFWNRKPVFSGVQQHVLLGALGTMLGIGGESWLQRRAAQRDSVIYNYILAHPEDFPPIERKKYAEVLERWVPCR